MRFCHKIFACCRCCFVTALWRHPFLRRGLLVLALALTLSVFLSGAPLYRLLLSEDVERARLVEENEQRVLHSQRFLQQYRASQLSVYPDNGRPYDSPLPVDVGITVLTMARGRRMENNRPNYRTEYLLQSVVRLMELMNDTSLRRTYSLHICNIDDHPESFAESKNLDGILPMFQKYRSATNGTPAPAVIWEKLKLDYVFCLQQTLAKGVKYALLVEDDAVAHAQLFYVLEHVLNAVVETPDARPVAYIKLYHPHRLLGYISLEVERIPELVALSLTLGTAITLFFSRSSRQVCHKNDTSYGLLQAWLGWAVTVAVLALAVGRANLLELRRLSPQLYQVTPAPSCCIPAVLYSRQGGEDFSRFLLNVTCTAKRSTDIRMDEFRAGHEARSLMVQPSLFQHIGLVSTLRSQEVSPLIVE